jgi:hypothetical protein
MRTLFVPVLACCLLLLCAVSASELLGPGAVRNTWYGGVEGYGYYSRYDERTNLCTVSSLSFPSYAEQSEAETVLLYALQIEHFRPVDDARTKINFYIVRLNVQPDSYPSFTVLSELDLLTKVPLDNGGYVLATARSFDEVMELSPNPVDRQHLMWCQTGPGSIYYNTDNPAPAQTWTGPFDASTLTVGGVMQADYNDINRAYAIYAYGWSVPGGKKAMNATLVDQYLALLTSIGTSILPLVRVCSSNCDPATSTQTAMGQMLTYDELSYGSTYNSNAGRCIQQVVEAEVDMVLYRISADQYVATEGQDLRIIVLQPQPTGGVSYPYDFMALREMQLVLHASTTVPSSTSKFFYTVPSLEQALEVKYGQYIAFCSRGTSVFFSNRVTPFHGTTTTRTYEGSESDVRVGDVFYADTTTYADYSVKFHGWTGVTKGALSREKTIAFLREQQDFNDGAESAITPDCSETDTCTSSSKFRANIGLIIGATIGGVFLLLLLVFLLRRIVLAGGCAKFARVARPQQQEARVVREAPVAASNISMAHYPRASPGPSPSVESAASMHAMHVQRKQPMLVFQSREPRRPSAPSHHVAPAASPSAPYGASVPGGSPPMIEFQPLGPPPTYGDAEGFPSNEGIAQTPTAASFASMQHQRDAVSPGSESLVPVGARPCDFSSPSPVVIHSGGSPSGPVGFCTKCGTPRQTAHAFCGRCGNRFEDV